jgi:energy-coupling factor transporter ATP-binding protein EcfA2
MNQASIVSSKLPNSLVNVASASDAPRCPDHLNSLGLPLVFMLEHLFKLLFVHDHASLQDLAGFMKIPTSLVLELAMEGRQRKLLQISTTGSSQADASIQLTEMGVLRAEQALNRCQYSGPLPVPLEAYVHLLKSQALKAGGFHKDAVRSQFEEVVVAPDIVDALGAAMNSGRATLLYGPAGSGKTYIVQCLSEVLQGSVYVPHAVYVAGDVMLVFDPLVHIPLEPRTEFFGVNTGTQARPDSQVRSLFVSREDDRWVKCQRPFIVVGGELTLAALDLQFDSGRRFYQAPPQIKANGGMLLIDDLGRQIVSPRELMNRWIVPLDRRCDYLTLNTGYRFEMPFDLNLIFSTNLSPVELADEAFLRRFGYKIWLGELSLEQYARLFKNTCDALDIEYVFDAFEWLIRSRHHVTRKPLLACYPRDILGRVHDQALYQKKGAIADVESLERAWNTYFVNDGSAA